MSRREALSWTAGGVAAACLATTGRGLAPRRVHGDAGAEQDDVGRVLARSHGLAMDHISLGVPDVPTALEWIREKTGSEP